MTEPLPLAPGQRNTRQRRLVWEAVGRLGGHSTADEIVSELQKDEPGFSRSTVYRALDALTSAGALHAVRLGGGPVHYEQATGEHQHAVCQVCQGVLHIEHELVGELEQHLEELHHFRPIRTEVLVVGVCESCARSSAGPRPARRRRVIAHVHRG